MNGPGTRAEPARPPRIVTVVRSPGEGLGPAVDWSGWYLTDEEDMGESPEQHNAIRLFVSVLGQLGRERSWGNSIYVGGDAFFAWMPEEPLVRVSPDVYVLEDPPPPPLPLSWQTWRPGHRAPLLAVEIVSEDWRKDYEEGPEKYAQLGARELVIFDPSATGPDGGRPDRTPLQVFHRTDEGLFVRRYHGPGPAFLRTLDLYAVVSLDPMGLRLRLSRDAAGRELVPTSEEAQAAAEEAQAAAEEAQVAAEEAQAAAEEAQAAAEEARAAAEAERDAEREKSEAGERELAKLRDRLLRLEGRGD
ncbi:MAG: Uma2 family endonuclease [Planctomycetes bacterium]|nr:Uma2 family endonuclease [Planctomycetota bacterium]